MEETNKNNKKKILIVVFIVVAILLIGIGAYFVLNKYVLNKETTVEITEEEKTVSLKDNFYKAINKKTIDGLTLTSDKSYVATYTSKSDEIDDIVFAYAKQILEENETAQKYMALYDKRYDGAKEKVQKYIDKVNATKTIQEFINVNEEIYNDLGVNSIYTLDYGANFTNKTEYILYLEPDSTCQYINDSTYASEFELVDEYNKKYLVLYGYSDKEATAIIKAANTLEKKICTNTKTYEEMSDDTVYTNIKTLDYAYSLIPNLNLEKLIKDNGYKARNKISIADEQFYKNVNETLTNEYLELYKKTAVLNIVASTISIVDEKAKDIAKDYYQEEYGSEYPYTEEEDRLSVIVSNYSDTIDQMYVKDHVTAETKEKMIEVVDEVIAEYEKMLTANTWLSSTTKEKAINKLKNIKKNVGYPDKYELPENEYAELLKNTDNVSYIDFAIELNNKSVKEDAEEYNENKPSEDTYWEMNTYEINAYYLPSDNSINFPAGIMLILPENPTDNEMMGIFGTVVAHEISHAFDNSGAMYDEIGNLNNWWTDEDLNTFEEKTNKVISYYSKYKSTHGYSVNGTITAGENIADITAVECIVKLLEEKNATSEDFKEVFEAYAYSYASKSTKQYENYIVLYDSHSPDNVRVNAVLSSIDKFYEIYDIKEGDKMYVAPENRVLVW